MGKIKELQEKYKKGEMTKAQYMAALAKLVEETTITQDEMDDALDYNPEAEKPIYTQADVDGMIASKAAKLVRKALTDAGVTIDASNKDLMGKVAEFVKIGAGKMQVPQGAEVDALKAKAGKVDSLTDELKAARLENSLLKAFAKPGYNPVSQTAVIALLKSDYRSMIDVDDETGEVDIKSVDRAVKSLKLEEPSLFKADETGEKGKEKNPDFRGKGPGGAGPTVGDKDMDAKKAEAVKMMGFGPKTNDQTKK